MFVSKKSITVSDSCDRIRAKDFNTILEMEYSGKSMIISIMVSKDAGDWLEIALYKADLPSWSGFKHWSGIVSLEGARVPCS